MPSLPPLEYVKALRDLGATFVRLGDAHIEFVPMHKPSNDERKIEAKALVSASSTLDRATLYTASLVDPIDVEADVADAELSEEDKAKKTREEFDRILFASAD